jgi:hypothetical protein
VDGRYHLRPSGPLDSGKLHAESAHRNKNVSSENQPMSMIRETR